MTQPTPHTIFARVVVDLPTRALSEPFDYSVPPDLDVNVGVPVLVPLGATRAVGYVVELTSVTEAPLESVRPIEAVLGGPLFDEHAITIADWISHTYVAPLSESLRLFLPPGGTPRLIRGYEAQGEPPVRPEELTLWTRAGGEKGVADGELGAPGSAARALAARMSARDQLRRTYRLVSPRVSEVSERLAELTPDVAAFVPSARATAQRAVIDALSGGPVSLAELRAELGSVDGAVNKLASLGIVRVIERRRYRRPPGNNSLAPRPEHLSTGQQDGLTAIAEARAAGDGVVLLEGVTGSGKTEVYLEAIEDVIEHGGRAIVLVPEISLTPQTVGRFRSRFGERVAVLHSRLSDGERYDQWRLALNGVVDVVVGARSALFAPLPDLELVVIDEEHESSYKQSASPRYHAREVAERICAQRGAVLVLGSATPSMEAHEHVDAGTWSRVELPERVGGGAFPAVTVVDMGTEFGSGHRSMFSRALLTGLERVRDAGEKAVLFLNRRGYASFLLCRECGYVPECPSCSVSLTYHEHGNMLVCHHCGIRMAAPPICPKCSSPYLRRFGAGTQRVEEELATLVPGLPIVRMDADTTSRKGGHERALLAFEAMSPGVLLGTQMVAKGLDYPDVTLVGVINADTTMHVPDFRAAERTYQLLQQVSGRAGRGVKPGEVVVQTYWPDHPAVQAVAHRDPELVYLGERQTRKQLGYPPYTRLVNVVLTAADEQVARNAAAAVARSLREAVPDDWKVLGPASAPLSKLKDRYRWHVLLKAPAGADVSPVVADALGQHGPAGECVLTVDVDPVDLM